MFLVHFYDVRKQTFMVFENILCILAASSTVNSPNMAEMSHLATAGILICLALMSLKDISQPADAQKITKDIPAPKLSNFAGPTLKFLYWWVQSVWQPDLILWYPHHAQLIWVTKVVFKIWRSSFSNWNGPFQWHSWNFPPKSNTQHTTIPHFRPQHQGVYLSMVVHHVLAWHHLTLWSIKK